MALKEYKPGTVFGGVIGRTFNVSSPPGPNRYAPRRAPNVGQMGYYDSPIATPNIY
ncbi:MAG TPA: hypothetical protein VGY99_00935 [Candidatus Binataceae bacterium]|jgi:hypothetical protein|nr:hypothetical protein [Candidatus Binataceae bacterium]